MNLSTPSIAVYEHGRSPVSPAVFRAIRDAGLRVEVCAESALGRCGESEVEVQVVDKPSPRCRMVLSLGGDGTFLKAAAWAMRTETQPPLAGVCAGHLGFLAAWKSEDVERLLAAPPTVRQAPLLQAFCDMLPGEPPLALNEVTVMRTDSAQMIHVRASLDGRPLALYSGDGLIVSTPLGSTGYNLSAGGPILQPGAHAMALTPVAPHTLTQRPLVLDADSELTLEVSARTDTFLLSLDGTSHTLPSGARIRVRRCRQRTLAYVPDPREDFAARLRAKLMWGADPRE